MRTDWIQTYTGKQFFPLEPRHEDIEIVDIAHALSNLCRYGGHTNWFYSVAQHCVLVSENVPPEYALHGLLHDASEAYLIDVPRPIKHSDGMKTYREYEAKLEHIIYERFGLDPTMPEIIKIMDNRLLRTEQRDLMKPPPAAWQDLRVGALETKIIPLLPEGAKALFLNRFHELTNAFQGSPEYSTTPQVIGSWQCPRCHLKSMDTWRIQPNPDNAPTCCGGDPMFPYRITSAEHNTKIVSRWIDEIENKTEE